eukprot:4099915-Pyramimonas_sp.AAC.1
MDHGVPSLPAAVGDAVGARRGIPPIPDRRPTLILPPPPTYLRRNILELTPKVSAETRIRRRNALKTPVHRAPELGKTTGRLLDGGVQGRGGR